MPVELTPIDGLLVVRWDTRGDERGFFRQSYQRTELAEALGCDPVLAQGNHARSGPGVLRGFHAEPWGKLIYVVRGTVFCAIADLRPDSETFGEVAKFTLGDPPGERIRLWVSEGLGNAYCTITEADYVYDVTAEWSPDADKRAVAWDDPDLGVAWPVERPTLSEADQANPTLRERFPTHPRFA